MRPFHLLTLTACCLTACFPLQTPAPLPWPTEAFPVQTYAGSAWNFVDPRAEGIPELMVATDQGYRVDESWDVQSIEYLAQWRGMSIGTFDYQRIECQAGQCQKAGVTLPPTAVPALLVALRDFYPVQYPTAGGFVLDSFRTDRLELVGRDGRRALLFVNGGRPLWNLLVNGRLYTQYNGALTRPLAELFGDPTAQSALAQAELPNSFYNDFGYFTDTGWPPQLTNGFGGLLPIADGVSYQVSPTAQTLTFTLQLPRPQDYGMMGTQINEVQAINMVEIAAPGQAFAPCPGSAPFEETVIAGPRLTQQFTCPLTAGAPTAQTLYQVQVTGDTRSGPAWVMTGELWGPGNAATSTLLLPLPPTVAAALAAHPAAQDLLVDHAPLALHYTTHLAPSMQTLEEIIGVATLAGQTTVAEQTVRYTVSTPMVIVNGQLQRWDLDRAELQALLTQVLAAPLTQQTLAAQPNTQLALWYAEYAPPLTSAFGQAQQQQYKNSVALFEWEMPACAQLPTTLYPNSTTALQGFSYLPAQDDGWPWQRAGDGISYSSRYLLSDPQFLWLADSPWPLTPTTKAYTLSNRTLHLSAQNFSIALDLTDPPQVQLCSPTQ